LGDGEEHPLSHGPLVWMVREARRAGLQFDEEKMAEMHCFDEDFEDSYFEANAQADVAPDADIPQLRVSAAESPSATQAPNNDGGATTAPAKRSSKLHTALEKAATKGVMHDCLQFGQGSPGFTVVSWRFMEYLPFKRMDLM
jgi:hypothetical protein